MVSLKDIAAELNLSISVVSRALNPAPDANAKVASKTKKLVLDTCERMGYRRNRMAEFVKRRRFPGIGVFLPKSANSLVANLIFGISEEAGSKDFPLLIHTGMDVDSYSDFMHNNLELAAGGIITYSGAQYQQPGVQKLLEQYCKEGGKVLILNDCTVQGYTKLYMDEFAGGKLAAQMLIDSKCQKFFCYRGEFVPGSVTQMRYEGFSAKLAKVGASCQLVDKLVDLPKIIKQNPACGVFTVSDSYALLLMQLAAKESLQAPDNFKLVGYDDMDWASSIGLSTIQQPFRQEGKRAAAKIIEMIYGREELDEILIPTTVSRFTTKI